MAKIANPAPLRIDEKTRAPGWSLKPTSWRPELLEVGTCDRETRDAMRSTTAATAATAAGVAQRRSRSMIASRFMPEPVRLRLGLPGPRRAGAGLDRGELEALARAEGVVVVSLRGDDPRRSVAGEEQEAEERSAETQDGLDLVAAALLLGRVRHQRSTTLSRARGRRSRAAHPR